MDGACSEVGWGAGAWHGSRDGNLLLCELLNINSAMWTMFSFVHTRGLTEKEKIINLDVSEEASQYPELSFKQVGSEWIGITLLITGNSHNKGWGGGLCRVLEATRLGRNGLLTEIRTKIYAKILTVRLLPYYGCYKTGAITLDCTKAINFHGFCLRHIFPFHLKIFCYRHS